MVSEELLKQSAKAMIARIKLELEDIKIHLFSINTQIDAIDVLIDILYEKYLYTEQELKNAIDMRLVLLVAFKAHAVNDIMTKWNEDVYTEAHYASEKYHLARMDRDSLCNARHYVIIAQCRREKSIRHLIERFNLNNNL